MSFDPVEASKIKAKRREEPSAVAPVGTVPQKVETPPWGVLKAPPDVAALTCRYRVKADRKVSINGCMTTISAGQVIDPAGYGADHVLKMIDQGVELEEIA